MPARKFARPRAPPSNAPPPPKDEGKEGRGGGGAKGVPSAVGNQMTPHHKSQERTANDTKLTQSRPLGHRRRLGTRLDDRPKTAASGLANRSKPTLIQATARPRWPRQQPAHHRPTRPSFGRLRPSRHQLRQIVPPHGGRRRFRAPADSPGV